MLSALFLATHLTTVCPDLSGRFMLPGEDGHVAIRIVQATCESLTIDWLIYSHPDTSPGTYVIRADGRARRERQWFQGPDSTWLTATWQGEHLEIVAETTPGDSRGVHWELSLGLTSKSNLCVGRRGRVVRGRLARRVGGQAESTDDAFSCVAQETAGGLPAERYP
jgi:hypothetical protein